jgi:hypothetical protein
MHSGRMNLSPQQIFESCFARTWQSDDINRRPSSSKPIGKNRNRRIAARNKQGGIDFVLRSEGPDLSGLTASPLEYSA